MSNSNQRRDARRLSRKQGISYTEALNRVRGDAPVEAGAKADRVLTVIRQRPGLLPYFREVGGRLEFMEPYDTLVRVTRARGGGHIGEGVIGTVDLTAPGADFDLTPFTDYFRTLLVPVAHGLGTTEGYAPPDVVSTVTHSWVDGWGAPSDFVAMLRRHLDDWPTDVRGWMVLGNVHWMEMWDRGGQNPTTQQSVAAAARAWQAGSAVWEDAVRRYGAGENAASADWGSATGRSYLQCLLGLAQVAWYEGNLAEAERRVARARAVAYDAIEIIEDALDIIDGGASLTEPMADRLVDMQAWRAQLEPDGRMPDLPVLDDDDDAGWYEPKWDEPPGSDNDIT